MEAILLNMVLIRFKENYDGIDVLSGFIQPLWMEMVERGIKVEWMDINPRTMVIIKINGMTMIHL